MLPELLRGPPEDLVREVQIYDAVGLPVFELDTAHEDILRRKLSLIFLESGFCWRIIDFDALERVVFDGCDQGVPGCGKLEPMAGHGRFCTKGPAPLVEAQQPFPAQGADGV